MSAQSQWTTSGNNIHNTNPGNVGIGTANPAYGKLQVNKGIRIDDDTGSPVGSDVLGASPMLYLGTSTGGAAFQFGPGGGLDLWQYNGGWGRTFTFARNGYVGVGAMSPQAPLQIGAYTTFNNPSAPGHSQFINNAYFSNGWKLMNSDAASILQIKDGLIYYNAPAGAAGSAPAWSERFRIDNSGNVGINHVSPAHRLDVGGNVNAAALCINGVCKSDWSQVGGTGGGSQWATSGSSIFYNAGNVGVGNSAPGSQLFVGPGVPSVATLPGLNVALGGNSYVAASNGAVNTFIGSDTSPYGIVGTLSNHPLGLRANNTLAVTVMPSGYVGIGTSAPSTLLDVNGNLNASGTITGGTIVAKYQDVAEWVPSRQRLDAGTVVVLDAARANHVVASSRAYDTRVAGVVSARPGVVLGEGGAGRLMVATTGRVRVRVDATRAAVRIGDLLVTGEREGFAMRSEPVAFGGRRLHAPGTIIGKALEPLEKGSGEILVLLSLQ